MGATDPPDRTAWPIADQVLPDLRSVIPCPGGPTPGLYKRERAAFLPFLIASPVLFVMGAALVYYVMLPFVMWFSLNQQINAPGLTVIDDWSSFGQRTTLSGTVLLDDVKVPKSHLVPAYKGYDRPTADGAIFQIIQAAVDAGIAQAAIDPRIKRG